jgi:predicted Zn-dependent peptidase
MRSLSFAYKWYSKLASGMNPSPGVSLLAARMLLEGTLTRTARQIADEVAFYGASLECEQGFDRATLTLYCLARHLSKLLPLVQDVVLAATFPETELEQLKTRTIQNVRVERQKTSYLAAERFSRNLYGADYPYGNVFDEQLFAKVSQAALKAFYETHYSLAQAEIFLCGEVAEAHEALVGELLGQPKGFAGDLQPAHVLTTASGLSHDYVSVADSIQSSLRIGRLWPTSTHPDTHQLQFW